MNDVVTGYKEGCPDDALEDRVRRVEILLPSKKKFKTDEDILLNGLKMLNMRSAYSAVGPDGSNYAAKLKVSMTAWKTYWHKNVKTADPNPFTKAVIKARLTQLEAEIVLALSLRTLGLTSSVDSCMNIANKLRCNEDEQIKLPEYLSDAGRLLKSKLVYCTDSTEDFRERNYVVSLSFLDTLSIKPMTRNPFSSRHENVFFTKFNKLIHTMDLLRSNVHRVEQYNETSGKVGQLHRKVENMCMQIESVINLRRNWVIHKVFKERGVEDLTWREQWVVYALVGLDAMSAQDDHSLYTGLGLMQLVTQEGAHHKVNADILSKANLLLSTNIIEPAGGINYFAATEGEAVEKMTFQLTDKFATEVFGKKIIELRKKKDTSLKEARIPMSQLVLSPAIKDGLDLALAQVRNQGSLMEDWGFKENFSYGLGTTLMFFGLPGTGKTASAEALAFELKRPLLTADYSKIQCMWVGETEKNIKNLFTKAKQYNAVLFWDEADAMIYDRDKASQSWEVRDVNVLLQELEQFQGVCILSTNRKASLDKAVERRISIKLEFKRPDYEDRIEIWKRLLPKKTPVAEGIDFKSLAKADLSGGEIKNVILNAARNALRRVDKKRVLTQADFDKAVEMEENGREGGKEVGFN